MIIKNLTPHVVRLNDGTEFAPEVVPARVSSQYEETDPGFFRVKFGEVVGLPAEEDGVLLIVSGIMMFALPGRRDLIVPATGHKDAVRRDGQIISVPGFVIGGN